MNSDLEMEERLWDYLDGLSSPEEIFIIKQLLDTSPAWHSRFQLLLQVQQELKSRELEMPSLRFRKNVMEQIAMLQVAPATAQYINKNVVRGIAAFFMLLILGLSIYFVKQLHWTTTASDVVLPDYHLNVGKFNWSRALNSTYVNIFLGMNTILALVFLDKYFHRKRTTTLPRGTAGGIR